jgi:23S rRNA (uracil1939-C5)-methyltransferase
LERERILSDAFCRIGGFGSTGGQIPDIKVVPSEEFGFRNRIELHRSGEKRGFVGVNREIVPVKKCPVLDAALEKALSENSPAISPPIDKDRWTVYGRDGLLLSEGAQLGGSIEQNGKTLSLDARAFFQSNGGLLGSLVDEVCNAANLAVARPAVARSATTQAGVADFYSGVGTFSAFIAGLFPHITLVEENSLSLSLSKKNLSGENASFYNTTCEKFAADILKKGFTPTWNFVVADPPRSGLAPALVQLLSKVRPKVFAYVSCNAATLARDAKALCLSGFTLQSLTLYDFYPHTTHIETLAVFGA